MLEFELVVLSSDTIDARVGSEDNLNALEVNCFADAIRKARPATAYVDACDVNAERFGFNIRRNLDFDLEIVSCHEADNKYPIVMAASILAKVHRDALISEISEKLGEDVGSGYPNDPVTIEFLKSYYKKNKKLPDCAGGPGRQAIRSSRTACRPGCSSFKSWFSRGSRGALFHKKAPLGRDTGRHCRRHKLR